MCFRYSILAPSAIPSGFVEGKDVTAKVLEALQMDSDQYKLGHTKVFFRAGVLGGLEEATWGETVPDPVIPPGSHQGVPYEKELPETTGPEVSFLKNLLYFDLN